MKKSSLIGHTVELLDRIRPFKQPADGVVAEYFRARRYLGAKDRRFIAETTYDILRHFIRLQAFASASAGAIGIPADRSPSLLFYILYALKIKGETVEELLQDTQALWQVTVPRVPAAESFRVLASVPAPESVVEHPIKRIAIHHSIPEFLVEEWLHRFGEEETASLCASLNAGAPIVIRVNTLKNDVEKCRRCLETEGLTPMPTRYSPFGLQVNKRFNAQELQSFKDGLFEIQDEGSQLIAMLLEPQPGQIIVDACAGGGGKTLHIGALMQNTGKILAIDVDQKRLVNIRPRLSRAGVTIVELLHAPHDNERVHEFTGNADAVLVDAPCSGVGTFRRNPAAKMKTTRDYSERMATTQQSVLQQYAALVRPGGRLVYSTCTLVQKENERVVENFLRTHPHFSLIAVGEIFDRFDVHVPCPTDTLLLLPHVTGTDGFFAAVMRRSV